MILLCVTLSLQILGEVSCFTSFFALISKIIVREYYIFQCTDVTDYIDKIIQEVLAGMDPKDICVKLKLCEPTKISKGILHSLIEFL